MQQIKSILIGWIETSRLCLSFDKVSWLSTAKSHKKNKQDRTLVVGEVSFYCARGKPHCGSKSMDQMRKEVASFKVIVNFKL